MLQSETWLEEDADFSKYELKEYKTDLNSRGRGKGIASYFNKKFNHVMNINGDGFGMSKLESKKIDVIGIYRSQGGNDKKMIEILKSIVDINKTTIIGGDMNVCVRAHPGNFVTKTITEWGFQQVVTESTHIDGGVIDHIYISLKDDFISKWSIDYFPKFYSDHDGVGLILWEDKPEEE